MYILLCYLFQGSVAYVPQQAWIQNASLQDNILFNKPYDPIVYEDIIDQCALRHDLKVISGGSNAEIGEMVRTLEAVNWFIER